MVDHKTTITISFVLQVSPGRVWEPAKPELGRDKAHAALVATAKRDRNIKVPGCESCWRFHPPS